MVDFLEVIFFNFSLPCFFIIASEKNYEITLRLNALKNFSKFLA